MSAALMFSVRQKLDPQHHPEFDAEMAKFDAPTQGSILSWLQKLMDALGGLGVTFSWPCFKSVLPQLITAFGNPAALAGVLAAYFACANAPPT